MSRLAMAIFVKDGRVLLGLRQPHAKRNPGKWDLIGGHVAAGETWLEGLIRECREEIGLTPLAFQEIGMVHLGDEAADMHVFAVQAWAGGEPRLGPEHVELLWLRPVQTFEFDLARPAYRAFLARLPMPS